MKKDMSKLIKAGVAITLIFSFILLSIIPSSVAAPSMESEGGTLSDCDDCSGESLTSGGCWQFNVTCNCFVWMDPCPTVKYGPGF